MKTLLTCCLFPLISTILIAQPSYLDQPEQFPFSNEDAKGAAIALSASVIGFAYESFDSLLFSTSGDSGKTWTSPAVILSGNIGIISVTGVKTNSGRVIFICFLFDNSLETYQLRMAYSDDLTVWSTTTISDVPYFYFTMSLTCTNDGKLWLCYTRHNDNSGWDLFYITSTNDGAAWSNENLFLSDPGNRLDGTIVSGSSGELLAFYSESTGNDCNVYEMASFDGGKYMDFSGTRGKFRFI